MKTLKTGKGTELPLLNLKGKDYLQVAYRLVWFREERPNDKITTEFVYQDDKSAFCRATITGELGNVLATAHKEESSKDFAAGHREKAETGAIGRALALCGYGTQFEPELDEGERIVDSPVAARHGVIAPERPAVGDGIQRDGYRLPQIPKALVDALGSNPSGRLIQDVEKGDLIKMVLYLDDKYDGQDMPTKTGELHAAMIDHIAKLEGGNEGEENG